MHYIHDASRALRRRTEQAALARTRQRLAILVLIFAACTAAIVGRLVQLSFAHASFRSRRGGYGSPVPARADILDRNGLMLATSVEGYSVGIQPGKLITPPRSLAHSLTSILPELDKAALIRGLGPGAHFRYLARHVRPDIAERINALGDPGLAILREPDRLYPEGGFAAHVLGSTDIDGVGQSGVERWFNRRLARDRRNPLSLSLDARVQGALEHELGIAMTEQRAIGASGVVLDARTGEIIAMTSLPQYNPNAPAGTPADTRFNRATLGVYELGSTFKAMTIAMALDCGAIRGMGDRYDATAPLHVGHFRIHDDHAQNRWLSVPEIYAYSSNIGAARIASRIGAARQRTYLGRLGFLDPVSVELGERGHPIYPRDWGEIATMTVGFGHGIAVTPLHLATAYAALVNGGIFHRATLMKVPPGTQPKGIRVFSEMTSATMRALMRLVVLDGTGKEADANGYRVGGKTGTAEKAQGGRYNHHALISTFAGAFPMDEPRYVIVAILDEPKGTAKTFGYATGGWVSAPVVRRVVQSVGPLLGILPDIHREIDMDAVLPFMTGLGEGATQRSARTGARLAAGIPPVSRTGAALNRH